MADIKNLEHAQEEVPEELENLKIWWNANGNLVTTILCIVLIAVLGVRWYNGHKAAVEAEALSEFRNAQGTEALERIVADAKTPAVVPLARIRLANQHYAEGHYDLAKSVYMEFLTATPKHAFAPIASIGIAQCDEALGHVREAAEAYAAFLDANPGSWLEPAATLGRARCLILQGDRREGKSFLDLALAEKASTRWAASINETILAIDRLAVPATKDADLGAFLNAAPEVPAAE